MQNARVFTLSRSSAQNTTLPLDRKAVLNHVLKSSVLEDSQLRKTYSSEKHVIMCEPDVKAGKQASTGCAGKKSCYVPFEEKIPGCPDLIIFGCQLYCMLGSPPANLRFITKLEGKSRVTIRSGSWKM